MSNPYFQFKQFRIDQGDCAMKVTTEGCLLGALINKSNPVRILDIGAGTGLLSLMLAQRYDCPIDAVEIDELAASQAKHNFEKSNWHKRFILYHQDIEAFANNNSDKYDFIISNPPFFKNNLEAQSASKNLAIHNTSLSQELFLSCVEKLLIEQGSAFIMYPEYEAKLLVEASSEYDLNAHEKVIIRNIEGGKVLRKIVELSRSRKGIQHGPDEFIIRKNSKEFTKQYTDLLRPYYLHL
ncbi:MAG: methyltransferase [Cyclobacteriaceae bacterium]